MWYLNAIKKMVAQKITLTEEDKKELCFLENNYFYNRLLLMSQEDAICIATLVAIFKKQLDVLFTSIYLKPSLTHQELMTEINLCFIISLLVAKKMCAEGEPYYNVDFLIDYFPFPDKNHAVLENAALHIIYQLKNYAYASLSQKRLGGNINELEKNINTLQLLQTQKKEEAFKQLLSLTPLVNNKNKLDNDSLNQSILESKTKLASVKNMLKKLLIITEKIAKEIKVLKEEYDNNYAKSFSSTSLPPYSTKELKKAVNNFILLIDHDPENLLNDALYKYFMKDLDVVISNFNYEITKPRVMGEIEASYLNKIKFDIPYLTLNKLHQEYDIDVTDLKTFCRETAYQVKGYPAYMFSKQTTPLTLFTTPNAFYVSPDTVQQPKKIL